MAHAQVDGSGGGTGCALGGAIGLVWLIAIIAIIGQMGSAISCEDSGTCDGSSTGTVVVILAVAAGLTIFLGIAFGVTSRSGPRGAWVRRVRRRYPQESEAALRELERLERAPGDPDAWVTAVCERMRTGVPADIAAQLVGVDIEPDQDPDDSA